MQQDTSRPNPVPVTTSRRPDPASVAEARAIAGRIGGTFVERGENSLQELGAASGPVIVVESGRVVCHVGGQEFFFHPGLTRMRLHGHLPGKIDPLLTALDLRPGDTVLDATLGRAGDATLIAHAVGPTGQVTGLEVSPIVAEIIRLGLEAGHYRGATENMMAAMSRIQVVNADHRIFLQDSPEDRFDVVYFDPMFDIPLPGSNGMDPLRPLARHEPLTPEILRDAVRVARRRVVVKSRRGSSLLEELEIPIVMGGRWSRLSYGVVEKS